MMRTYKVAITTSSIGFANRCNARKRTLAWTVAGLLAGILTTESAMAAVTKVYWTDRDNATLSVTNVGGGGTTVLVPGGFSRLQDVDLHPSDGRLYFSDWGPVGTPGGEGSINRVNTDGTGLGTVLSTGDAVHQLALDGNDIYFTRAVSYDNREISRVGTNGAGYTVLHSGVGAGTNGWFYSGLAVDSANDRIYWGDIGILTPAPPADGAVNSITLAGGSPTTLVPHVNGKGRGFALDQASQTIFYTAHDPQTPSLSGAVFAYDIASGTDTQIIPTDATTGYWDIEICAFDQRIWWTAYSHGQVLSANFDGSDVQVELSGLTNPYGLALECVPEPTSLALLAFGGLMLARRRR